ncbi:hypothetical protein [Mucilaginibacter auburnensis]|uniref:Uncharacterized protein n=1 Tax=Mucilaginibacter auburnensis TaxID=1457233 RepID=A0A2H9VSS4_9SPHI|nr:hypothetical protein [Mucilaginibacter auburnensis]PJJ83849.1 hypothetical protein CLV57_0844 [Mucilaginibacter auburnensis]
MKQKYTLLIAALFIAGVYSSCKKDAYTAKQKVSTQADQATTARQMATSLYKSFSAQFNSNTKATNGLKVNANPGCGLPTITPTNKTVISGDTTRKFTGNSTYTTLCSKDEWTVDSYTLYDTLRTTETGPGFANNYTNTQYYYVKGPMSGGVPIVGTIGYGHHLGKVTSEGVTNEFHDLATQYTFNSLVVNPFAEGNKFLLGRIDFSTQTVDLSPANPTGMFGGYSGFIFYVNNTARIYFRNTEVQGGYTRYILDFATGQMTGPVNSYPFPVDYVN